MVLRNPEEGGGVEGMGAPGARVAGGECNSPTIRVKGRKYGSVKGKEGIEGGLQGGGM